jgi:hypothetical protein
LEEKNLQQDRKTVFDLPEIIIRCFEEAKKLGYISNYLGTTEELIERKQLPVPIIVNQNDLAHHISRTIIGELYELEIIRRIVPIFRENRALTHDFLLFGDAFELFYDKQIQEQQLSGLRIEPAEGGGI